MKLLTNFPLELFGDRAEFPFEEIRTFGPSEGRVVGDITVPYDLPFDASRGTLDELLHALGDFVPDAIMLWWPDQDPIPIGLEKSAIPTIAVVSDYNLTLPTQRGLHPFFDLLLCDHSALLVLGRLPFAKVEPWCQFSFRPDVHRCGDAPRDLDITFLGNLHPVVQRTRLPWLNRLRSLEDRYRVHIGQAVQGREYGELLARSRIVFNRSVRGEINLRCFEATACGALLFCERENLEVREFFREDEEVVLYGPDDFEAKLVWYLENESARAKIAQAGQRRVQDHRLAQLARPLPELFANIDPRQRAQSDAISRLLARGESMLLGRCESVAALAPLVQAADRERSARTLNSLAVGLCTRLGKDGLDNAFRLLITAREMSREDVHAELPTLVNLARLHELRGDGPTANRLRDELVERASSSSEPAAFDGLVLPLGFQSRTIAHTRALAASLRDLDLGPLRNFFTQLGRDPDPQGPMPGFEPAFDGRTLTRSPDYDVAASPSS